MRNLEATKVLAQKGLWLEGLVALQGQELHLDGHMEQPGMQLVPRSEWRFLRKGANARWALAESQARH